MITNEQIIKIALDRGLIDFRDIAGHNVVTLPDSYMSELFKFARELITLAQQVKPLKFWPCKLAFSADPTPYLRAESVIGPYLIYRSTCQNEKTNYHFSGVHSQSENMSTEAEAIEAANADYRKRVLSCLVWGGGE